MSKLYYELEDIRELIGDNKIDTALDELHILCGKIAHNFCDEVILLKNQYNNYKGYSRLNLISKEEDLRLLSRIVKSILDVCSEIEKQHPPERGDEWQKTARTWLWLGMEPAEFTPEIRLQVRKALAELLQIPLEQVELRDVHKYKSMIVYLTLSHSAFCYLVWMEEVQHPEYLEFVERFDVRGYVTPN